MTDYFSRLEDELRRAARAPRAVGWRGLPCARLRRALALALVAAVVATPALAGVPGIWGGVFAGSPYNGPPTLSNAAPDPRLLLRIGALRRLQAPADRSPAAVAALRFLPLDGVSVGFIRYVGLSPIGQPLFIVPYRSQDRVAGVVGAPPPYADPSQPGVCLVPAPDTTLAPDVRVCANLAAITSSRADFTVVGIRAETARDLIGPAGQPAAPPTNDRVVNSLGAGIVPDGVASVVIRFDGGASLTVAVQNNYFVYPINSAARSDSPTGVTWLDSRGRTLLAAPPFRSQ